MADHVRTQCRDAVVTLWAALTTTGSHVYPGRSDTRPLQASELPGILVYTNTAENNEEQESGQQGTRRVPEVCELVGEAYAKGTGDIDRDLDTMEKEMRAAIGAAPTLSGKAKDLKWVRSEKEEATVADKPTWRIRVHFRLEYHTREAVPDTALA